MKNRLDMFEQMGFLGERGVIIRHLQDSFAVVNEAEVQACIMFGTLPGELRHDDSIPWDDEGLIVLPSEETRYEPADSLPLGRAEFLGMSVWIPQNPANVLHTYAGAGDWMDRCGAPQRDPRNGGMFTDFPQDGFRPQGVMAHLSTTGERDLEAARRR